jgi:competence protein ComEC
MKRWPQTRSYVWERVPFLRLLLPLAAGIVLYDQGRIVLPVIVTVILLAIASLAASLIRLPGNTSGYCKAASVYLFLLIIGWASSYFNDQRNDALWFGKHLADKEAFSARLLNVPQEKEKTWKLELEVTNALGDGSTKTCQGRAFAYIYKDGAPLSLNKGDVILLPAGWKKITNAGNPSEFNYAAFAARQNIHYQQFVSRSDIQVVRKASVISAALTDRLHDYSMKCLETYIPDRKALGLIQAMLIGDEAHLDQELLQSYSETGIVHIIAISGGHIAIFFLLISSLLFWIRHKKYHWLKYALALPLVWFYILMAGAPPSAVRAGFMFSLLGLGFILGRNQNPLNQLMAAAFIMLLVNPAWLFTIGFQLSFVAVLSLMLFYKYIAAWIKPKHTVTHRVWQIVAASLAAEILVAPLVIYYFHLLPIAFAVTNLLAWLFMGAALIAGTAIIVFSWVPTVAAVIGSLTSMMVVFFNGIVEQLQELNPAALRFLYLSGVDTALLYFTIACFAYALIKRHRRFLYPALSCIALLLISSILRQYETLAQEKLVLYNTSGFSQLDLIQGHHYIELLTDTAAPSMRKKALAVKESRTVWNAWTGMSQPTQECIRVGHKTLLILNEPGDYEEPLPFKVDYLLINYPLKDFTGGELQNAFHPEKILLGGNQKAWAVARWEDSCRARGIGFHAVRSRGAFVVSDN